MKFARIEMLFFVWALPVLFMVFVYGVKKRRRILTGYAKERGLGAISPDRNPTRRRVKAGLLLFALLLLAFALAGPQYGYKWQEIERKGIDIIVALDCSRSMLADDIKPTRLDRAKREVYDLLTLLQGDRVGLVAFAGTAFLQCPLTLDYNAFHLFLSTLTPDFLPVGGTDLFAAVSAAMFGFNEKENSEKAIILITDGENTGDNDPVAAAEAARNAGIKIFCIGVGGDEGVPVPNSKGGIKKNDSGKIILTRLDENTLKKMAVITGGVYVRSVAGDMDLDAIYTDEIRGKMESATLSSGRKQVWEDRFQWFLAIAIIALVVELLLPSVRKTGLVAVWIVMMLSTPFAHAGAIQDGIAAYEKEDYEAALKFFIDAQLDDPDNPEILYNIGNAYYKMGDYEAAYNNYLQAIKSQDNAGANSKANSKNRSLEQKTVYNLGNSSFRKGGLEEAVKHYESALSIDPDDAQARQNLEYVKKRIQQQKTRQNQQQDQEKSDDQTSKEKGSPQGDPPDDKNDNKNADKKEKSSPDYGKEMKPEKDQDKKPRQESGDQKKNEPQDGTEKQAAQAASQEAKKEPPDRKEGKKQAERMLNRLKDQPGKAMIPFYQQKNVEKDW